MWAGLDTASVTQILDHSGAAMALGPRCRGWWGADTGPAQAAERAAFTGELTEAVTRLVGKYHDPGAPGGRDHRLLVAAHPLPTAPRKEETSCP